MARSEAGRDNHDWDDDEHQFAAEHDLVDDAWDDDPELPEPDSDDDGIDTIRCSECGTWIDEDAAFCGRCGQVTHGSSRQRTGWVFLLIVIALVAMLGLSVLWFPVG